MERGNKEAPEESRKSHCSDFVSDDNPIDGRGLAMTRSSSPLHLLHSHLSPSLLPEKKMKKMPRTRVQVAPAAIVCTGYDSVCRFAGPIKRDGNSCLFIAFPHSGIGVTRKWWRALKGESESTASGSIFGLTWPLLEEPRNFDKTGFLISEMPLTSSISWSLRVSCCFIYSGSQPATFLHLFLLFENILTLKTFSKDEIRKTRTAITVFWELKCVSEQVP